MNGVAWSARMMATNVGAATATAMVIVPATVLMPWWGWIAAAVAAALLMLAGGWLLARSARAEGRALVQRVAHLPFRAKLQLAGGLWRDGRVPLVARLVLPALVLYLAMPIDIIPDVIPVVGYLDDVLVLAAGLGLLLRLTPRSVLEEHLLALEGGPVIDLEGDRHG